MKIIELIKKQMRALKTLFYSSNIVFVSNEFKIGKGSKLIVAKDSAVKFNGRFNIECYAIIRASYKGTVIIGKNVFMGDYSTIRATDDCTVYVGNDTMIAQGVKIISTNHSYTDKTRLIKHQHVNHDKKGVSIGNDCWLGAGCTILPGVTVGDGAVIGANSLVTKNIPAYAIAVGSPAKVIKYRQ